MDLSKFIEEKIQKAIADGEFDNLAGRGKPIDMDAYFNTPSEYRMGHSLLKANNFVPEEVEMLREIGLLKEKIKTVSDESEKKFLTKTLNEKSLALSILLERNKRKR
jgi:hypothetical protein